MRQLLQDAEVHQLSNGVSWLNIVSLCKNKFNLCYFIKLSQGLLLQIWRAVEKQDTNHLQKLLRSASRDDLNFEHEPIVKHLDELFQHITITCSLFAFTERDLEIYCSN